jgi:nicotinamide mononucleotide transporter PnuC
LGLGIWRGVFFNLHKNMYRSQSFCAIICAIYLCDSRCLRIYHVEKYRFTHSKIITCLLSAFLGFVLSFTNQSAPFLDSFIGVFGILATYLTIQKLVENWIIWIIINLLSIVLFVEQELYFSSILFLCYLFVSIVGYVHWTREILREKTN